MLTDSRCKCGHKLPISWFGSNQKQTTKRFHCSNLQSGVMYIEKVCIFSLRYGILRHEFLGIHVRRLFSLRLCPKTSPSDIGQACPHLEWRIWVGHRDGRCAGQNGEVPSCPAANVCDIDKFERLSGIKNAEPVDSAKDKLHKQPKTCQHSCLPFRNGTCFTS